MKNTNTCPKCHSQEIMRIPDLNYFSDNHYSNIIPTGLFSVARAKITRYICISCGFSEEWVESKKEIQNLLDAAKGPDPVEY